jgi:predicted GNAT family acetyltransferase
MIGVKIEKAMPSNLIDVYDLFKKAAKEGLFVYPQPTEEQIKEYYFMLLQELADPRTLVYIARKGKQFLGYVHGHIIQRPWGSPYMVFIKMCFVIDKKRKLGVSKDLVDKLVEDCKKMGVTTFEFMANDEMCDYWSKKRKARKVLNYMVVEAK